MHETGVYGSDLYRRHKVALRLVLRLLMAQLLSSHGRLPRSAYLHCLSGLASHDLQAALAALLPCDGSLVSLRLEADDLDLVADALARTAPFRDALRAIAFLAGDDAAPCSLVSDSYQQLLGTDPDLSGSGVFRLVRNKSRRKDHGCFYTPQEVARTIVEEAIRPLLSQGQTQPRVLDLTMGTGVFLLETARYLGNSAHVAETCLYGVDRDPIAVDLAILSLWLASGARPECTSQHLIAGDPLRDDSSILAQQFDAVVGNPPWGARFEREERQELTRRFPRSSRLGFDSFKFFVDLACTVSTGTVGLVLPQAMLAQERHADVRALLLARFDPFFVEKLEDRRFWRVAAPACILVFGPKVQRDPAASDPGPVRRHESAGRWDVDHGFPLAQPWTLDLLARLQTVHPSLGELADIYRVRDTGINYNRASVARRVLYEAPTPEDPLDLARYRGRDFARYTAVGSSGWLRHDARQYLQPGESLDFDMHTYGLPQKLVLRQTADRIIATLDTSQSALGRSVLAITAEGSAPLGALLACLNSHLITVLYRALAGEKGRILPQVKVGRLKALPVPRPPERIDASFVDLVPAAAHGDQDAISLALSSPAAIWHCLEVLAHHLLLSQGQAPTEDRLIDQLVYHLYGLDQQETALVEMS